MMMPPELKTRLTLLAEEINRHTDRAHYGAFSAAALFIIALIFGIVGLFAGWMACFYIAGTHIMAMFLLGGISLWSYFRSIKLEQEFDKINHSWWRNNGGQP